MFTVIALLRSLLSARRLAKVPIVFTKEMRHRGAVRLYIEGRFSQDGEEEETILAAAAACCEHVALVGDSGSGELQVWVPPELGLHVEITSGGRAAYRSALHAYLLEHGATSLTTLGHAVPKHRFVGVGTLSSFVRRHAAVFVLEDGIVRLGQTITFVEPGGHQCSFQERTKHTVANIITGRAVGTGFWGYTGRDLDRVPKDKRDILEELIKTATEALPQKRPARTTTGTRFLLFDKGLTVSNDLAGRN